MFPRRPDMDNPAARQPNWHLGLRMAFSNKPTMKKVGKVSKFGCAGCCRSPARSGEEDAVIWSNTTWCRCFVFKISKCYTLDLEWLQVACWCRFCLLMWLHWYTQFSWNVEFSCLLSTLSDSTASVKCPVDPYFIIPDRCVCVDFQTLRLQESPDAVPHGEMPRHLQLYCDRYVKVGGTSFPYSLINQSVNQPPNQQVVQL